jgi:hypothetical protein
MKRGRLPPGLLGASCALRACSDRDMRPIGRACAGVSELQGEGVIERIFAAFCSKPGAVCVLRTVAATGSSEVAWDAIRVSNDATFDARRTSEGP